MSQKSNEEMREVAAPRAQTLRTILSRDLMGNDKVVIIRHEQEDYRLRITAAGKLILTK
jgi:hemin uptake protein HemP